jgi:Domain of unknown function (DUF4386)
MPNVASPTYALVDAGGSLVKQRGPSGRVAALTAGTGIVLAVVSGLLFFATGGVSAQGTPDTQAMLATGASGADLVRWASFLDLFGYLLLAPLALYLRQRFRHDPLIDLYTVAGLAYILFGALGAIILASAAPMLMRDYATASVAQRESIATTFATLNQIVSVGLWQILEGIPAGVWLIGIGTSVYHAKHRLLSFVPFALGGLLLLIAVGRILGF